MRTTIATASAAAVIAAVLGTSPLVAQEWPDRPVKIMLGFGAGGGTDVVTRVVAEPLGDLLGQRIIVENKPGAGGALAGDAVARGPKDGYTALMISGGHTVSAVMVKTLGYDPIKDFTPVGVVANSAFVIVANKDFPANDLKGLIAEARKSPGKLNYASVGIGSTQHLTAELLRQRADIDVQHVSFRNTPEVITALLRKDVSYAVELAHAVRGQVASGDLKILAVTTAERWPSLPNVPTVIEQGMPGFDVLAWYGLIFPAGVPQAAIDRTQKALAQVLARDNVKAQLSNVGALPALSTPQEFGKLIETEIVRWRDVATKANLEPK